MSGSRSGDAVWRRIREELGAAADGDPVLGRWLEGAVLQEPRLEAALVSLLAGKLAGPGLEPDSLRAVLTAALDDSVTIRDAVRADLEAILRRDPAACGLSEPFLYYKGFHALAGYRVAHWLWERDRHALARHLQSRISEVFGVDIHPAARIGKGILIDHATGVVIGETAVVADDVSLLHEVTLGGTGKETGDRHPKVGRGVLIGAGAKVLGNVRIGEGATIGAGSVVLDDVPPHVTVAGVPARVIGKSLSDEPALEMDQRLRTRPD